MRTYYDHHGVDWDVSKVLEQTLNLENWDILLEGEVIGVIRLVYESDECYLRDIQVSAAHQNKGIGAKALEKVKQLAQESGAKLVKLRVLKISPAYNLYHRNGYGVTEEDEKFYYMKISLSDQN